MKKISIIVPMYYEQEVVNICYERIKNVFDNLGKYSYEIIFINDGSKDNTLDLLKQIAKEDKNVKLISFSRNFGQQAATVAGLKYAKGDAAVIIDADMQDPPEVIPDMLKLWEEGNAVIYAVRNKRDGETIFKLVTSKAFYRVLNKLSDIEIPLDTGDFRVIDRKVIDAINNMPEHNKFLRGIVSWTGFKQVPYMYDREQRVAGKTKYPLKKSLKLSLDGIVNFSVKPLKTIGKLGIFAVLMSLGILIYSLISYLFKLNSLIPGWTSIMVTITFLFGLQFISIWIISEYVARIYDEVRKRPEYIIEETQNIGDENDR